MKRTRMFVISAGILGLAVYDRTGAGWRAGEQKETEQVDRNFPFQPGGELILKNFSGTHPHHRLESRQRRRPRRPAGRPGTASTTSTSTSGPPSPKSASRPTRRTSPGGRQNDNVVETDFEIEVPQRITLDVHAFSSDIHVESIEGKQKLYAFSGTIRVDDSSGPLTVETFSGGDQGRSRTRGVRPAGRDENVQRRHRRQARCLHRGDGSISTASAARSTAACHDLSHRQPPAHPGRAGRRRHNTLEFKTFSGDVS